MPPVLLYISNEYLLFRPEYGDENADGFVIVNLRKENATIIVPDPINDTSCKFYFLFVVVHLCYYGGYFYISNNTRVCIVEVQDDLENGEVRHLH